MIDGSKLDQLAAQANSETADSLPSNFSSQVMVAVRAESGYRTAKLAFMVAAVVAIGFSASLSWKLATQQSSPSAGPPPLMLFQADLFLRPQPSP